MSKRAASSKAKSQVASANLEPEAGQQHLVESPRRKRSKQPDDEVASRAAELRRGGAKQCDIATELGFTQRQVSSMLAKHGLQTQKQLSEAEAAEAVELCKAGMKQIDAAGKFGVSQQQISKALARGGAAPRTKAAAKRRVEDQHCNGARSDARWRAQCDFMEATLFAVAEWMFLENKYRLQIALRQGAYMECTKTECGYESWIVSAEAVAAGEGWWKNEVNWLKQLTADHIAALQASLQKWESTSRRKITKAFADEYIEAMNAGDDYAAKIHKSWDDSLRELLSHAGESRGCAEDWRRKVLTETEINADHHGAALADHRLYPEYLRSLHDTLVNTFKWSQGRIFVRVIETDLDAANWNNNINALVPRKGVPCWSAVDKINKMVLQYTDQELDEMCKLSGALRRARGLNLDESGSMWRAPAFPFDRTKPDGPGAQFWCTQYGKAFFFRHFRYFTFGDADVDIIDLSERLATLARAIWRGCASS